MKVVKLMGKCYQQQEHNQAMNPAMIPLEKRVSWSQDHLYTHRSKSIQKTRATEEKQT